MLVTDMGWEPLVARVLGVLQPLLRAVPGMPSSISDNPGKPYAFATRNWRDRPSNATFKRHRDQSRITLNVCLLSTPDLAGSGVHFWADGAGDADPPAFELRHRVGWAAVHLGVEDVPEGWATVHQTQPCTAGRRCNLILWGR
eukprot:Hpha_TRINITY_DN5586_c0_g1::TRINITY_DN5586_c0_g1_i1::g.93735::m.93735